MDLGLNITTYTFGSPRLGNEAFARFVVAQGDRNYRVTHVNDIVPMIPWFRDGWRHVEPEYWLQKGPCTRTHYTLHEIQECQDWTEESCLEGYYPFWSAALDYRNSICSHHFYLNAIDNCGAKEAKSPGLALDELLRNSTEQREHMEYLREGYVMDIKYAASLYNDSLLAEYEWSWEDE